MAASAELAIEQIHPDYEEGDIQGWGVYNPMIEEGRGGTHGTMMFYSHQTKEWWHIDTTTPGKITSPGKAQEIREDVWSPFHQKTGFHPGESQVDNLSYEEKSIAGWGGLLGSVVNAFNNDIEGRTTFATDTWMDEAYKHIRNDGEIEPVLEPVEQLVQRQRETNEYVGIIGDSLEDAKLVTGDLEGLYSKVMADPEIMTEDKVYQWLKQREQHELQPQHRPRIVPKRRRNDRARTRLQ
jgi:hypothetical protein